MRAMWTKFGKPGGPAEGMVGRPYTMQDARDCLAEVSGDREFADEFFDRYIQGRDVVDYAALLEKAGLLLRASRPRPRLDRRPSLRFRSRRRGCFGADHRGHAGIRRRP